MKKFHLNNLVFKTCHMIKFRTFISNIWHWIMSCHFELFGTCKTKLKQQEDLMELTSSLLIFFHFLHIHKPHTCSRHFHTHKTLQSKMGSHELAKSTWEAFFLAQWADQERSERESPWAPLLVSNKYYLVMA